MASSVFLYPGTFTITGNLVVSGVVQAGDGTVALPAYSYVADTDLGQYRIGANNEGFSAGGALIFDYNASRILSAVPVFAAIPALVTTSTDGFVAQNATAATGAVTVQISPRTRWVGTAWDTAASETVAFFAETLPATAATPTGTWKLGYSLNGAAATYPLTVSSAGVATALVSVIAPLGTFATGGEFGATPATSGAIRIGNNQGIGWRNASNNANVGGLSLGSDNVFNLGDSTQAASLKVKNLISELAGITASGALGVPVVVATGRVTAQSAANASISTFTVGAADASFEVSANMNVTVSTTLITTLTCTYTDESNTARSMIFPVASLSGSFIAAGAITGAGASVWETPVLHIRCKAATVITILTSAGTFTGVTYTAEGNIVQTK